MNIKYFMFGYKAITELGGKGGKGGKHLPHDLKNLTADYELGAFDLEDEAGRRAFIASIGTGCMPLDENEYNYLKQKLILNEYYYKLLPK